VEHSFLHGAALIGLMIALAAPLLVLGLLAPVTRRLASDADSTLLAGSLAANAARWAMRAALLGAAAALLDLPVAVAEIGNVTLLAGFDPAVLVRFASATTVGRLGLARAVLFLACGAVAGWLLRSIAAGGTAGASAAPRSRTGLAASLGSTWAWLALGALALGGALATSLVSHAAAQPTLRAGAVAGQALHLVAAAVWIGVLAHLALDRRLIARAGPRAAIRLVAPMIERFSPVALTGAGLLALSGVAGAYFYLRSPERLLTSPYGLTLTVKLLLVLPLLAAGLVNYRIVLPALRRAKLAAEPPAAGQTIHEQLSPERTGGVPEGSAASLARLARMIELEVTAGLLVVAVAGVLGSVSPPGEDGSWSLTPAQIAAVTRPRLPVTQVADPATWVGSAERTADDLRYSEFMHNWSGVIVCFLGLAWLAQSVGGRLGRFLGRLWPLVLIPFAAFVAVASDPEVWPLGTVSPWLALRDPIVFEHRIGALMILALVWLGLREERRAVVDRPLGRSLPVLMIVGSLLLLGHAHSSLTADDHLAALINAQHAVLGGLGLLAGVVRWLEIRRLVPARAASILWPALVIAVGVFMAFSYRELV